MIKRKLTSLPAVLVVGLSVAALAPNGASAQSYSPSIPEIEWDVTLNSFQFDADKFIGQRFTAKCAPSSGENNDAVVYGTDSYPSNNSICIAAAHAGKIDQKGGMVTVQLNSGKSAYTGSSRNGVESASLPGTRRSMAFVNGSGSSAANEVDTSSIPRIKWDTKFTTTGFAHRQLVGQRFTFNCPAAPSNLRPRRVVGTDSYAFHSMICRAAVHAGKITTDGGIVSVQMDPGMPKLVGSIRNGIESKDGPGGHRTLSFVDGPA